MFLGVQMTDIRVQASCADFAPGTENEWSLIFEVNPDGTENKLFPRVLIDPIDSKKAFIRFAYEWVPQDKNGKSLAHKTKINEARFLDLRTLLLSLYNVPYSLKRACDNEKGPFKGQNLPQKLEGGASGKVTHQEIEYARQDVRCTAALLNAAKKEFDLHPIPKNPDKAYSPASIAKGYLEAMGIERPDKKFNVSHEMKGIALQTYYGGRSETRLRLSEVDVVPVDFTSEYPTVCVLQTLWDIITAEKITFDDATKEVREMCANITFENCFNPKRWPDFRFFAQIIANDDVILPVRTMYNGNTSNIGDNYLSSKLPIWVAGPDLINSIIRTGKIPKILKVLRLVNKQG
jgi:hypothetical protein